MRKPLLVLAVLLLVSAVAFGLWTWSQRPRLTESEAQNLISTTLLREVPESFLVTGTLDYVTRVESSRQRKLVGVPGIVEFPLGTTRVAARVPGRVSYGFDVRELDPASVTLRGDTVEVRLPHLRVFTVEADLARAEIQTDEGWGPLLSPRANVQERSALQSIRPQMRRRAERHLRRSGQPERNAARAIGAMLRPAFAAAGHEDLVWTLAVGDGRILVLPPESEL